MEVRKSRRVPDIYNMSRIKVRVNVVRELGTDMYSGSKMYSNVLPFKKDMTFAKDP